VTYCTCVYTGQVEVAPYKCISQTSFDHCFKNISYLNLYLNTSFKKLVCSLNPQTTNSKYQLKHTLNRFWHLHVSQMEDINVYYEKSIKALPFDFSNRYWLATNSRQAPILANTIFSHGIRDIFTCAVPV
jgi:hypothetical protein